MPKQRMMKTSITGPRLRAEIDALLPLSFEEREKVMEKMSVAKLALMNDVIAQSNRKEIDLEKVTQAILWEMPNGRLFVEINGKG